MVVGHSYEYAWPDGKSVGKYVVTDTSVDDYGITWSNGASLRIRFNTPLHLGSVASEAVLQTQ